MLLGLDFLIKTEVILDCRKKVFFTNGEAIPMIYGRSEEVPAVSAFAKSAKVTLPCKVQIPPQSVINIKCDLSQELSSYIVEPSNDSKILVPRGYFESSSKPCISLLNVPNTNLILPSGTTIGEAIEADCLDTVQAPCAATTQSPENDDKTERLPDQLQVLYEKSTENLSTNQKTQLHRLLYEFSDVLAKDDFDLGTFDELEHSIDTGDARPIKQRIRRIPMCFAKKEEQHLKKMLDVGIIGPSNSEWASAPVLVRMRDGSVRWCIDYRKVNDVTRKEVYPLP